VVKHANRLICEGSREVFATACYLTIDPSGECRFALAGHPPPLVTGPRGSRLVEAVAGAPLGVSATSNYHEAAFRLADDERIVLFTDGLFERRDEMIDHSLARLVEVAHGIADIDAESLATAMVQSPIDDLVVLVVRWTNDRETAAPSGLPDAPEGQSETDPTLPVA
jgi:serine phosphatase RsbU (regulator of sigma subunit)